MEFLAFQKAFTFLLGTGMIIKSFMSDRYTSIDLFSLYVLFSHFRPRDATPENSFFQVSSYARANVRITCEKTKENSHENITWSEIGKQNVQAEKVYCQVDEGRIKVNTIVSKWTINKLNLK